MEPENRAPCLGLCALTAVIKKKICAKFPGQFPFGILRVANDVAEMAESKNLVAQDRAPCLGLCALTYKILWVATYPMCQLKPPFGR